MTEKKSNREVMWQYVGRPGPSLEVWKDNKFARVYFEHNGESNSMGNVGIPKEIHDEAVKRHTDMLVRHRRMMGAQELVKEVAGVTTEMGAMQALKDTLWPPEEPDRQWSPDTMDEIAQVLINAGYGPDEYEKSPDEPGEVEDDPDYEGDLDELCTTCGHRKGEHAQFIDRTAATMTDKPQRRHCMHFDANGKENCGCRTFTTELVKKDLGPEYEQGFKAGYQDRKRKEFKRVFSGLREDVSMGTKVDSLTSERRRFEESIVSEACIITRCIEESYPDNYIKNRYKALHKMCRLLMELGREKKAPPRKLEDEEYEERKREAEAITAFMETRQAIVGVDCQECGACCCPPAASGKQNGEGQAYVELVHSDLVRLGTSAQMHMVRKQGHSPNTSGYHLQAYKDKDGQVRCPYFYGEVGGQQYGMKVKCGCGVHEQKPYACRVFEKGGEGCRQARASHPRINKALRAPGEKELLIHEDESRRYDRQAEAADSIDLTLEVGEGRKLKHLVHDEYELTEEKADE
jgi:Fe-S-cluster containining protein